MSSVLEKLRMRKQIIKITLMRNYGIITELKSIDQSDILLFGELKGIKYAISLLEKEGNSHDE